MTKKILSIALLGLTAVVGQAQKADSLALQEVVVTGTRNATDVRHLPMTVTGALRPRSSIPLPATSI